MAPRSCNFSDTKKGRKGNTSELKWGKRRVRSLGGHENKQELKSSTGSEEKDVMVENTHYSKRKLPAENTRTATLKRRKPQDPICARELNALREEMVTMRRDMEKVKSKEEQDSVYLREEMAKLKEDMEKVKSKEEQDSVYLREEMAKLKEDLQKIVSEKQAMNSTIIDLRRGQDGSSSLLPLKIEEPSMETSGYIFPIDQATTDHLSLSLMSNAQPFAWLGEASAGDVDANGVSTELTLNDIHAQSFAWLGEASAGDVDANGVSTELDLRIN